MSWCTGAMGKFSLILVDSKATGKEGKAALRDKMAERFNASPEVVDSMLSELPVILEQGLSKEQAEEFGLAFDQMGAIVELVAEDEPEEDSGGLSFELSEAAPAEPVAETASEEISSLSDELDLLLSESEAEVNLDSARISMEMPNPVPDAASLEQLSDLLEQEIAGEAAPKLEPVLDESVPAAPTEVELEPATIEEKPSEEDKPEANDDETKIQQLAFRKKEPRESSAGEDRAEKKTALPESHKYASPAPKVKKLEKRQLAVAGGFAVLLLVVFFLNSPGTNRTNNNYDPAVVRNLLKQQQNILRNSKQPIETDTPATVSAIQRSFLVSFSFPTVRFELKADTLNSNISELEIEVIPVVDQAIEPDDLALALGRPATLRADTLLSLSNQRYYVPLSADHFQFETVFPLYVEAADETGRVLVRLVLEGQILLDQGLVKGLLRIEGGPVTKIGANDWQGIKRAPSGLYALRFREQFKTELFSEQGL